MKAMTETLRDSNAEALCCKKGRDFHAVKKIKLPQEHFWLVGPFETGDHCRCVIG